MKKTLGKRLSSQIRSLKAVSDMDVVKFLCRSRYLFHI